MKIPRDIKIMAIAWASPFLCFLVLYTTSKIGISEETVMGVALFVILAFVVAIASMTSK